jgi:hypothetical protein
VVLREARHSVRSIDASGQVLQILVLIVHGGVR